MVKGIDMFREYFEEFTEQYVLIGGSACDISFHDNNMDFRAAKDLDMVLVVEALTKEFAQRFWKFIQQGKYRNRAKGNGKPQFFRFSPPAVVYNSHHPIKLQTDLKLIHQYISESKLTPAAIPTLP